jgi:hypothetical protein
MFKQFYIRRNLALLDEVQKHIADMQKSYDSDKSITDTVSLGMIAAKVNGDYRESLAARKKWQQIREDDVLLTALRDELKRLKRDIDYSSKCG